MNCQFCNSDITRIDQRYSLPVTTRHATAYGQPPKYQVDSVYSCKAEAGKNRLRAQNGVK